MKKEYVNGQKAFEQEGDILQKHGTWIRYNRKDQIEYDEIFENGKIIRLLYSL